MKTIGIVGTRTKDGLPYYHKIKAVLETIIEPEDRICSGLCPKGGDRFAVMLAKKYGNGTPLWFPAEWPKYGRAAGFKRNTDIAKNSDILIAVVADDRTGGTEDTIKKFRKEHPNAIAENKLILIF